MSHPKPPQYAWGCQYCGLSSPGGTLYCGHCGFPAHTSAFELRRAQQLGSVQAYLAERDRRDRDWRTKPMWKKASVIVAVPLFVAGITLLRVAASERSVLLGAAIIGAAAFLFWVAI